MSRLVVVSNRVAPIRPEGPGSVGGLAIAMQDALRQRGGVWFGWSGKITEQAATSPTVEEAGPVTYATIDLNAQDYDEYYTGFANSVLWPLFHYRLELTDFSRRDMAGYHRVNAMFAKHLAPLLQPDDVIWVHDYHFIPLGDYLRQSGCRNRIGFFLHISWPPTELLLAVPNHQSLVRELLAYDLLGFQTEDDRWAFEDYVRRETKGLVHADGSIEIGGNRTRVGVFPISIDTGSVAAMAQAAEQSPQSQRLLDSIGGRKFMIGIDRLDYTKGLPIRMEAYQHFLVNHTEYKNKVIFVQIAPPSRAEHPEYRAIRQQMESLAGHINGHFAEFDWAPLTYLNRSYQRKTLMGFLRLSQVGVITPLRDGMNLVAKEYIAAQSPDDPGVLVLSRFAGAAYELDGALIVNPYDVEGVGEAMATALSMPLGERRERWQSMFRRLQQYDLVYWRESYIDALQGIARAA